MGNDSKESVEVKEVEVKGFWGLPSTNKLLMGFLILTVTIILAMYNKETLETDVQALEVKIETHSVEHYHLLSDVEEIKDDIKEIKDVQMDQRDMIEEIHRKVIIQGD